MGDIIKIDAHTNHAIQGQFARICVQVAVDQLLRTVVYIGDHIQHVIYEGINQICFLYGTLGHKDFQCPNSSSNAPLKP